MPAVAELIRHGLEAAALAVVGDGCDLPAPSDADTFVVDTALRMSGWRGDALGSGGWSYFSARADAVSLTAAQRIEAWDRVLLARGILVEYEAAMAARGGH